MIIWIKIVLLVIILINDQFNLHFFFNRYLWVILNYMRDETQEKIKCILTIVLVE